MSNYDEIICEAIETIVNKKIATAPYDKTIRGTIIECVDSTIGKYRVQYQNTTFFAYANSSDVFYNRNADVYILVPGNDMSNDKTILGTTEKLGINYINNADGEDAYEVIGTNTIISANFDLCSYKPTSLEVYNKNNVQNLIQIDNQALKEYMQQSSSIICAGKFKTQLPIEQQFKGNYGIIFELNFKDNATEEIATREYVLDINQMEGNPYKTVTTKRQYGIFNIDGKNFIDVNRVILFAYDFPKTESDKTNDIFISDIELCGSTMLKQEELSSCSLSFVTLQGTYFKVKEPISATRQLEAQVRVRGKIIDNNSQKLDFYWFKEDLTVTSKSERFCKFGGQGWACLNQNNIIQEATATTKAIVEWIPNDYKFTIAKSDVPAKETKYKCVVNYNNTILSKEIIIKNLASTYEVIINSDGGNQFYYDIGSPNLTCNVLNGGTEGFTYQWAVVDNNGNFKSLEETTELNQRYNNIQQQYNNKIAAIENEQILPAAAQQELNELKQQMEEINSNRRIEKNKIFNVPIYEITNYATYKCAVYYNNNLIGIGSITLTNELQAEGVYNLVIQNGTQVFKYNEDGIAPTSISVNNPLTLLPLTFTLYDNLGQAIDLDIIKNSDIEWIIPTENTMLDIPKNTYGEPDEIDLINHTETYKNLLGLSYVISNKYYINKQNNNITLKVKYKDMTFMTKTNFTFTKEGQPGTNGTDFVCKIIPNVKDGGIVPTYPMVSIVNNVPKLNYELPQGNNQPWFRVQLWKEGDIIFDSKQPNSDFSVEWEILKNNYGKDISDNSNFTITKNDGIISIDTTKYEHPANIIKCTIEYNGMQYYATMPIIIARNINGDIDIKLKDNTGFQFATYSADGTKPQYDNANPFEIIIKEKINNYWEDISNLKTNIHAVTFNWSVKGQYYHLNRWNDNNGLISLTSIAMNKNQHSFKPEDMFNGYCVSNAVYCEIVRNDQVIGNIHIPVHMLLNKFSNTAINGWDGNSVSVDKDGNGVILAPQMGAGKKDENNAFTGLLMGVVKEVGKTYDNVGMFGYNSGSRTIFLNSESGSAIFGTNDGQIIIDPSQNKALLFSRSYWNDNNYYSDGGKQDGLPKNYNASSSGQGMLIDLTTPCIKYGNGNFEVNSNGHLTAKGGGYIAGWQIGEDKIYKNGVYLDSTLQAFYSNDKNSMISERDGFYIGSDGFALGAYEDGHNPFQVTSEGSLFSSDGSIGGFIIDDNTLIGGSGNITVGMSSKSGVQWAFWTGADNAQDAPFHVGHNGELHSSFGTIGGWTIGTSTLTGGNTIINSNGSMSGPNWSITNTGYATFTDVRITNGNSSLSHDTSRIFDFGENFYVQKNGVMKATNANFSGAISGSSVTGGTVSGTAISGGTISGAAISGGSITGSSVNTMSVGAEFLSITNPYGVFSISNGSHRDESGELIPYESDYGQDTNVTVPISITVIDGQVTAQSWRRLRFRCGILVGVDSEW